jgi:hypothetical protein
VYGQRCIAHGQRRAPTGQRHAPSGQRHAPSSQRRAPSSQRRAASSRRRGAYSRRRVESKPRRATLHRGRPVPARVSPSELGAATSARADPWRRGDAVSSGRLEGGGGSARSWSRRLGVLGAGRAQGMSSRSGRPNRQREVRINTDDRIDSW